VPECSPRSRSIDHDVQRVVGALALGLLLIPVPASAQEPRPRPFPTPVLREKEPEKDPAREFLFPLRVDWETQLPDVPVTWPTYDAEHAYIPTRSGELFAVSLNSGEILRVAAGHGRPHHLRGG
jgi:hypothetical protein